MIKYVLAKSPGKATHSFSRKKSLLVFDTEEVCRKTLDEVGLAPHGAPPWNIYRVSQDVGQKPTVTHLYTQPDED